MWSKSKKIGDFGGKPAAGLEERNEREPVRKNPKGKKTMGSYAVKKSGFAGGIVD